MTTSTLYFFHYKHLPPPLHDTSKLFHDLAHQLEAAVPDGPEKTAGMRKLLEAKDCFIRALVPHSAAEEMVAQEQK